MLYEVITRIDPGERMVRGIHRLGAIPPAPENFQRLRGLTLHTRLLILRGGQSQRLADGSVYVFPMLNAHGDPDIILPDSGEAAGLRVHIAVGGRGGMDDEGFRIADVGRVRHEADPVDKGAAGIVAALEGEAEHGAVISPEVAVRVGVGRMAGKGRMVHPRHGGVTRQRLGEADRVFQVTGIPDVQAFKAPRITSYNVCYTKLLRTR